MSPQAPYCSHPRSLLLVHIYAILCRRSSFIHTTGPTHFSRLFTSLPIRHVCTLRKSVGSQRTYYSISRKLCIIRGFAKLKKFQKKIGSGWVDPGAIRIKKIGKSSKKSVASVQFAPAWRCTWRLKVCMHSAFSRIL